MRYGSMAMNVKNRAALSLALLLAAAGAAVADGPYLNATGGVALVPGLNDTPFRFVGSAVQTIGQDEGIRDWEFDAGFVASGALGYKFGPARVDAEFSYITASFAFPTGGSANTAKDDNFTALLLLANFWYDVDLAGVVAPYAGLGLGGANLSAKLTDAQKTLFDGSGWGFAFQAGAGVVVNLVAGFSIDLGYRFSGSLQTKLFDRANPNLSSLSPSPMAHRIQLGVRFPS